MTMGSRSTKAALAAQTPQPEPRRPEDRRGYHADRWFIILGGVSGFLTALIICIYSWIFVERGRDVAAAWLEDITGPAFIAGMGALCLAAAGVVFKVRQIAKGEMWAATAASTAASTKAEVASSQEETRRLLAELTRLVEQQPAAAADTRTVDAAEAINVVVRGLVERMARIEARSQATQDVVVGYGGQLEALATLTTGELRAQTAATVRDAAAGRTRAAPLWTPGAPASPTVAPEATPPHREPPRAAARDDPLDTSRPHRPAPQQPALDEQEDWQPDGGGPGLPTGIRRDFREAMARAQAEPPPTPANPWLDEQLTRRPPPALDSDPDMPEAIRRARERSRQEAARAQLRDRWNDPEEGPR